jgi:hypothetical protein
VLESLNTLSSPTSLKKRRIVGGKQKHYKRKTKKQYGNKKKHTTKKKYVIKKAKKTKKNKKVRRVVKTKKV